MSPIAYIQTMDTVRTPADIGNVIRATRKSRGWDQARLANEIGASRQWIVDIEKGKPRAELQLILRALQVLGLELLLAPGGADARHRLPPDHAAMPSINLDDIVERNRTQRPLSSLYALKNVGKPSAFHVLEPSQSAGLVTRSAAHAAQLEVHQARDAVSRKSQQPPADAAETDAANSRNARAPDIGSKTTPATPKARSISKKKTK
ncbi:type II toxin-antitoxin system Y4mF family antitoxin [Xanthomonas hortorum pv. pelargonii]|nr:type II toxin-antitoxin system Y4mF family antitoxin [Xanthomonas hortorum pv. pelargonii]